MRHMKTVLEELEIGYSQPLQPVVIHPSSALSALRASQSVRSRVSSDVSALGNMGRVVGAQLKAAPGPTVRVENF